LVWFFLSLLSGSRPISGLLVLLNERHTKKTHFKKKKKKEAEQQTKKGKQAGMPRTKSLNELVAEGVSSAELLGLFFALADIVGKVYKAPSSFKDSMTKLQQNIRNNKNDSSAGKEWVQRFERHLKQKHQILQRAATQTATSKATRTSKEKEPENAATAAEDGGESERRSETNTTNTDVSVNEEESETTATAAENGGEPERRSETNTVEPDISANEKESETAATTAEKGGEPDRRSETNTTNTDVSVNEEESETTATAAEKGGEPERRSETNTVEPDISVNAEEQGEADEEDGEQESNQETTTTPEEPPRETLDPKRVCRVVPTRLPPTLGQPTPQVPLLTTTKTKAPVITHVEALQKLILPKYPNNPQEYNKAVEFWMQRPRPRRYQPQDLQVRCSLVYFGCSLFHSGVTSFWVLSSFASHPRLVGPRAYLGGVRFSGRRATAQATVVVESSASKP